MLAFIIIANLIGVIGIYYFVTGITESNKTIKQFEDRNKKRLIEEKKPDNIFRKESDKLGYNVQEFENIHYYPYIVLPGINRVNEHSLASHYELNRNNSFFESPKIGRSEFILFEKLLNKYGDKFIWGCGMNQLDIYYPDISFIDEPNKIFIDIEIDEPYELQTKSPIHYNDFEYDFDTKKICITDKNKHRDSTFSKKGLTVIRFSEEQVLTQPEKCLGIIDYIINFWKRNYTLINLDENTIVKHKRWNLKDISEMILKQHREEGLKKYFDLNPEMKLVAEKHRVSSKKITIELKNSDEINFRSGFKIEDEI